jgi:hypothetical protein
MKTISLVLAALVLILVLPFVPALLSMPDKAKPVVAQPQDGLPWQIESLPDGASRVFGLIPGRSTLADARRHLGPDPRVALIIAPGESGAVEAYYESVSAGFVTGKMVLTMETTQAWREEMLQRARKAEYMKSTTRQVELAGEDLARIETAPISAIAFIPSAQLDEQVILQRFGTPAERIRGAAGKEHFLYPDKGLDLLLDDKGKELLQYVAPREFARLRVPLQEASADSKEMRP